MKQSKVREKTSLNLRKCQFSSSVPNFYTKLIKGQESSNSRNDEFVVANDWFLNRFKSEPSVWLTAWVVRIFTDVSFQDWEDFIYIDPKVRYQTTSIYCTSVTGYRITLWRNSVVSYHLGIIS